MFFVLIEDFAKGFYDVRNTKLTRRNASCICLTYWYTMYSCMTLNVIPLTYGKPDVHYMPATFTLPAPTDNTLTHHLFTPYGSTCDKTVYHSIAQSQTAMSIHNRTFIQGTTAVNQYMTVPAAENSAQSCSVNANKQQANTPKSSH